MNLKLKILKQEYFNEYKTQLKVDVETAFATLKNKPPVRRSLKRGQEIKLNESIPLPRETTSQYVRCHTPGAK